MASSAGEYPQRERDTVGHGEGQGKGRAIGRPAGVDKVDSDLVVQLKNEGKSWREIAEAHPPVKSASVRKIRPSMGPIRRAFAEVSG